MSKRDVKRYATKNNNKNFQKRKNTYATRNATNTAETSLVWKAKNSSTNTAVEDFIPPALRIESIKKVKSYFALALTSPPPSCLSLTIF